MGAVGSAWMSHKPFQESVSACLLCRRFFDTPHPPDLLQRTSSAFKPSTLLTRGEGVQAYSVEGHCHCATALHGQCRAMYPACAQPIRALIMAPEVALPCA